MRYLIAIIAAALTLGAITVNAAPVFRIERTILPETDSAYELGTSTRAWLRVFTDELCLNADCKTAWPTGGGSGTISTSTALADGRVTYATGLNTVGSEASFLYDASLDKLTAVNASTTNLTVGSLTGFLKGTSGLVSAVSSLVPGDISLAKGNFLVGDDAGVAQATSTIFIDSTGNVGIGTTTPFTKLFVESSNTPSITLNSTGTGSAGRSAFAIVRNYPTTTGWQFLKDANDDWIWRELDSGTPYSRGIFRKGGILGIGTTTPYAKFSLVGDVNVASTTMAIKPIGSQTANILDIYSNAATPVLRDVITAAGNWGIGSTSPYAKLSVKGAGTTTGVNFQTTNSADAPLFTILDSGKVGIGTTTPDTTLNVVKGAGKTWATTAGTVAVFERANSTSAAAYVSVISGNTGTARLQLGDSDSEARGLVNYDNSTDALSLWTAGSQKLTVLTGGNVGIGTTTPYAALSLGGGNLVLGAASAGGTPGDLYLPKLGTAAGAFLAVDASGKVIATTTPGGAGTVTSVAATVPTGFSLSGSPITTTGTLAISYAAGYQGLLTASSTNWNAFYDAPSNRITDGTGLTWSSNTLNCDTASGSVQGCLSAADWTTFNAKESALTFTYPLQRTTNTISLAFGTTTANQWGGLQSFVNTGTTTFAGGIQSGTQVSAPFFHGTSTTASSTINLLNGTSAWFTSYIRLAADVISDFTGFGMAVVSGALGLDTTGAADEECLTYEGTGPTTDWQPCASASEVSAWVGAGEGYFSGTGVTLTDAAGGGTVAAIAMTDGNNNQLFEVNFRVPDGANGKAISKIELIYENRAASALNVYSEWKTNHYAYSNGGTRTQDVAGATVASASPSTSGQTGIVTAPAAAYNGLPATVSKGDIVSVSFNRFGAEVEDTYGQTLYVIGMMVTFQ